MAKASTNSEEPRTRAPRKKRSPVKRVRAKTIPAATTKFTKIEQTLKELKDAITALNSRVAELESGLAKPRADISEAALGGRAGHTADEVKPQFEQAVEPGAEIAMKIWRTYKWQAFWVIVVIDLVAWLASWDGIFNFFFGLIMLVVFVLSLKAAISGYRRHYSSALHRLQEK